MANFCCSGPTDQLLLLSQCRVTGNKLFLRRGLAISIPNLTMLFRADWLLLVMILLQLTPVVNCSAKFEGVCVCVCVCVYVFEALMQKG